MRCVSLPDSPISAYKFSPCDSFQINRTHADCRFHSSQKRVHFVCQWFWLANGLRNAIYANWSAWCVRKWPARMVRPIRYKCMRAIYNSSLNWSIDSVRNKPHGTSPSESHSTIWWTTREHDQKTPTFRWYFYYINLIETFDMRKNFCNPLATKGTDVNTISVCEIVLNIFEYA